MFQENILLSRYSNYRIGGPARYFFEAKNIEEIIGAIEKARQENLPVFILGGGTNILFNDEIFNGLILKPNIQFVKKSGNSLRVGAGVSVTDLLNYSITNNLSGLEWAAGLPGTVGGAIRGNAGAFGGEMKTIVKEIVSLDISRPRTKILRRDNQDCGFNYRSSIFKINNKNEIIVETTLVLKKGDKKLMKKVIEQNINYRQEKQPLEYPNIGSIFKNVPLTRINADIKQINADTINVYLPGNQPKSAVMPVKTDPFPIVPAGHLISEAGLKGVSCGGAMISAKHPNFIVNVLGATSRDVKNLIFLAKNEVKRRFGIELEEEIESLV